MRVIRCSNLLCAMFDNLVRCSRDKHSIKNSFLFVEDRDYLRQSFCINLFSHVILLFIGSQTEAK